MTPKALSFGSQYDQFWFRPISAVGFGLMRIAFGLSVFLTFLLETPNVERYYGPEGILPQHAVYEVLRSAWRFSLLDYVSLPMLWVLFILLLTSAFLVMIGIQTKRALLLLVILLFSFHEYGTITLDGGDTLLRLLGFILLLSPCGKAMSFENALKRFRSVRETGKDQDASERTMPIWSFRMLLWQMILIYVSSAAWKMGGETWWSGSATAIALHHGHFSRFPMLADLLTPLSPLITYFTLFSQLAWVILLPLGALSVLGKIHTKTWSAWKRALLISGVLIHGSIFLLMDIGTFSLTVLSAYLGLLTDDDFDAIRERLSSVTANRITVLFDGRCGFCKGSVLVLKMLDWLHLFDFQSYHDPAIRKKFVPSIDLRELNEAMHIVTAKGEIFTGFFAIRHLLLRTPVAAVFGLLLYIPGVSILGSKAYAWVSEHRA